MVLALHLAGPSEHLHGRMLRHEALRPLQGRAHRRLHQRRRDQGQQGTARYGILREVPSKTPTSLFFRKSVKIRPIIVFISDVLPSAILA